MNIDHYALFGHPVAHSQSPFIHQQFAQATGQSMDYTAILTPVNDFAHTLQLFFAQNGKGCNVTLPFKEEAYLICAHHTAQARAAKAVNTILYTDQGLLGDNTDGAGLLADLRQYIHLRDKKILIIGAGGATRGILLPLIQEKPASITIANRTVEKATLLCQEFVGHYNQLAFTSLTQLNYAPDIIINATSASVNNQDLLLPDALFAYATLAYDLMYGSTVWNASFLQQATRCKVAHKIDGLGMLIYQAAEAFYRWRGIYPDTKPVFTTLRTQLAYMTPL